MKWIVEQSTEAFNRRSAQEITEQIGRKADSRISFATGSTTKGIYRELAALYRQGGLDFSRVEAFVLDEYQGASQANPASCLARLTAQLFDQVNMDASRIHFFDSMAADLHQVAEAYERNIRALGGIDLQVLGLGANGHIGFNEPGTPFHAVTRVVDVGEETIEARAEMFGSRELVPRQGITLGIKTIMQSRKIFLFANGEHKATIVEQALFGPVTPEIPASVLQLHPDLTVVLDRDAAGKVRDRLPEDAVE
ncbi:putative glucosamine-6-phosphate deaminase 2 [Paenibacillus sp. CECT 9249]|uniref:glucosamine-6-phosphate deaminase n=1 Tax=Paenibacillus sp. CECT 9249 TaxID=2845385 RepID=UPI001E47FFF2|nr:glucosamine-6-phosphate deaminase [Paenibacillus sp. CECT 9249]CAH0120623.1 putative glucosamine-6-phosphate deaminase 2 [Paenibacillus sp. CECT 9249]